MKKYAFSLKNSKIFSVLSDATKEYQLTWLEIETDLGTYCILKDLMLPLVEFESYIDQKVFFRNIEGCHIEDTNPDIEDFANTAKQYGIEYDKLYNLYKYVMNELNEDIVDNEGLDEEKTHYVKDFFTEEDVTNLKNYREYYLDKVTYNYMYLN